MKALVLYSSQTGRTKKFAEAIRSVLPDNTDFLPMEEAPASLDAYDIVFAGIWFLDHALDSVSRKALKKNKCPPGSFFCYDAPKPLFR